MTAPELPIPIESPGKLPGLLLSDILLMVGVGVFIAVALIVWAIFIRKPRDLNQSSSSRPSILNRDEDGHRHRKRHKKRRRNHRTRNPSLAETGGLPSSPPPATGGEI